MTSAPLTAQQDSPALVEEFVSPPEIVLRAEARWSIGNFREVWQYRDLLLQLAWRDIKIRYKQTALGVLWAVLQPVASMLVFGLFFGRLAGLERRIDGGIPYSLYVFAALLPWQLFATIVSQSANSLVNSQNLIGKVYFPRLVLLLAVVGAALVDFAISFVVLLALMAAHGIAPRAVGLTLPLFLLFAVAAGLSVGVWLATLNVEFRDIRHAIPFLIQFWMFVSPIAYPSNIVPLKWQLWYSLNPLAGVIDGFRWAIFAKEPPAPVTLLTSSAAVLLLLFTGLMYFARKERTFADSV